MGTFLPVSLQFRRRVLSLHSRASVS